MLLSNIASGYEVAILAGGFGTRLSSISAGLPKSMIKINGKTILEHQILNCIQHDLKKILIFCHHESQQIIDFLGDGKKFGVNIGYFIEAKPRGTGGALFSGLEYMADNFYVFYGDTFFDVNLTKFMESHRHEALSATILLHPNSHPHDSDLVEIDPNTKRILTIHPYPHKAGLYLPNLVNAALYVFNKCSLESVKIRDGKFDIAKQLFPEMIATGHNIYGYISSEYIKDMGTPERLKKVERDIDLGLPSLLSDGAPRRAVFLDRDGTIIENIPYLTKVSDVKLIRGAAQSIGELNARGFITICITNQPVIARGELTIEGLEQIHNYISFQLGGNGAYLDGIYFCPHHPEVGFKGEVKELKIECSCRKPGTLLIDEAIAKFNINASESWFIGDSSSDILAGSSAGLKTILVKTGLAGSDQKHKVEPNYIFPDISDAIFWITKGYPGIRKEAEKISLKKIDPRLILVGGAARSGKSTFSQVLSDVFVAENRSAHVICVDGWLKPQNKRAEGGGVLGRYQVDEFLKQILTVIDSKSTTNLNYPIYDRMLRASVWSKKLNIEPDDVIILEGVITLLIDELIMRSKTKIYVEALDDVRQTRLKQDYQSRGLVDIEIEKLIFSRENDEVLAIKSAIKNANEIVRI